ncbi:cocaine- and amphetamine-regulated transcript 4 [Scleropages formosus]|uniref:Cocaine- and amphetamine-regulated transcript 4 n=1 Tax=Scleropages formosus TaxID=113540 RepID=A0A8D0CIK8_SCLFO|nr:cocaine- and amphetamine-regulated transcript protein-like [Scleropages formosus]
MERVKVKVRAAVYLGVCLSVFSALCRGQGHVASDPEPSSQEDPPHVGYMAARELAEALGGLLEGEQDHRIFLEKKASVIPRCDVGERCAMKHGPRIGRLCDCLRGTACNSFFLRCY